MLTMENDSIDPDLKLMIACVIGFVVGIAVPPAPIIANVSVNPSYDSYSLTLTAVDGFDRPPAGESPLSPAFNLELHVENSRFIWENCFSHGAVAASYNGVAMGEGRVAGWCTGARSTTEVGVLLRGKDVQLPDGLRRRM